MFFWPGPRFFSDQQMNMILVREVLSLKFNQKVSKTIKNDFFVKKKPKNIRAWLNRRQIDGSLNRTPLGFYDRVWQILERTSNGIMVGGLHLPQVNSSPFCLEQGFTQHTLINCHTV